MKLKLMAAGAAVVVSAGLAAPAPAATASLPLAGPRTGIASATNSIVGTTTDGTKVAIRLDARPNTDVNRLAANVRLARQKALTGVQAPLVNGHMVDYDPAFNQARFIWAAPQATPTGGIGPLLPAAQLERVARDHLASQAELLSLSPQMLADAELTEAQYNGNGPAVVRLRQRVNGTEVFNESLNVLIDRQGRPVAVSGGFATTYNAATVPALPAAAGTPARAVVAALADLGVTASTSLFGAAATVGRYQVLPRPTSAIPVGTGTSAAAFVFSKAPRARPVYYPEGSTLVPAYYVEIEGTLGTAQPAYMYVVAADTGRVLFRNNMRAEVSTTYRVFADPNGINQPYDSPLGNTFDPGPTTPGVNQARPKNGANLVTLDYAPMLSTKDPWLAAGNSTTTGNNADAFLDSGVAPMGLPINDPTPLNGYVPGTGDLRTAPTATNTYDYPIHADDDPSGTPAKNAAIVNLFYMNNWLHDFWYDHGFNEASGNAQTSNYGRGGQEGDAISAQGQDSSGRNNANMSTPADGSSPTMQMYLFDGPLKGDVTQTIPAGGSPLVFKQASFGPTTFNITGALELANDNDGTPTNGCLDTGVADPTGLGVAASSGAPDAGAAGKVVLVDRGACSFTLKERFAMTSAATAMIVVNNDPTAAPIVMGDSTVPSPLETPTTVATAYTVPAVMISYADGQALKALLAKGTAVTMHVERDATPDYDGTLDEQVISHEFFHHVSNRLINDGSGLGNMQGGGMGEGWSDNDSMILTVRPEDMLISGNELYQSTYPLAFYVFADQYYGIRRMPYSTQFKYNSLTFKHIQDGTRLDSVNTAQGQVVAPIAYGTDGATNSEVHATGEVWANMMWNCYAGIQDTPNNGTFEQKRLRYMDYVIAGLKMTPSSPTFTQARDGVLAAAFATNAADYQACARGYAKRGAGIYAISPPSSATDNVGVTEDYIALTAKLALVSTTFVAGTQDCDEDDVLDANENGTYQLTFRNDGTYAPNTPIAATVTTTATGITFGNGGKISIPPVAYGQTVTVAVPVTAGALTASPLTVPLSVALDPLVPADPAVQLAAPATGTTTANADGTPPHANSGVCVVKHPTPFTFQTRTDVPVSSFVTSEAITLAGFTKTAPISVAGGNSMQYSVNGGAFTADPGRVAAGDKVTVRHLSASASSTPVTTSLTVGDYTTTFKSVTAAAASTPMPTPTSTPTSTPTPTADHVPDAFGFGETDGVAPGVSIISQAVTPVNYDNAPVTASQGITYSINGGAFTAGGSTITKGQSIRVKLTSSKSSLGYAKGYVTIGGVKGTYTLRTRK